MIVYDEKDIVRSYIEARNKRQQINILAELNGTDQDEIIDVLMRNSVELPDNNKNNACVGKTKKIIPLSVIEAVTIHKRQLEKNKKTLEDQIEELDKFLRSVVCE